MKKLYIDCRNGISGDMVLAAFEALGTDLSELARLRIGNDYGGSHGRSFEDVKRIIGSLPIEYGAKKTAVNIYTYIAKAEAKVHGATLETVHFHEVGRDRAILNMIGAGISIEQLKNIADSEAMSGRLEDIYDIGSNECGSDIEIYCSEIHDGRGFIECSHGKIPVPVPAVKAMMENCDYRFFQDDVETEMVTPSGLAMLLGMGAKYISDFDERLLAEEEAAKVHTFKCGIGKGGRSTGRDGLKMYFAVTDQR